MTGKIFSRNPGVDGPPTKSSRGCARSTAGNPAALTTAVPVIVARKRRRDVCSMNSGAFIRPSGSGRVARVIRALSGVNRRRCRSTASARGASTLRAAFQLAHDLVRARDGGRPGFPEVRGPERVADDAATVDDEDAHVLVGEELRNLAERR